METTHHLHSWAGTNTSLVPVCSRDHVFFLDPETETQPHRNQLWDSRTKQKGCHGPVSESRRRSERPTPQSLTRRQKMTRGLGTRQPTQHQQNHRWHNAVPLLCLPACLPMQTARRRSLYLPAPVSTILFTEHHDPSHRRYHQDGSAAWTRSGNMLDMAARHSLQPPVLRSPPPWISTPPDVTQR